jgi:hypothetical protein
MINNKLRTLQLIILAVLIILPLIIAPFLPSVKDHSGTAANENAYWWGLFRQLTVWGIVGICVLELGKSKKKYRRGHFNP